MRNGGSGHKNDPELSAPLMSQENGQSGTNVSTQPSRVRRVSGQCSLASWRVLVPTIVVSFALGSMAYVAWFDTQSAHHNPMAAVGAPSIRPPAQPQTITRSSNQLPSALPGESGVPAAPSLPIGAPSNISMSVDTVHAPGVPTTTSGAGEKVPAPGVPTTTSGAGDTVPAPGVPTTTSGAGDTVPAPGVPTTTSGAGDTVPAPGVPTTVSETGDDSTKSVLPSGSAAAAAMRPTYHNLTFEPFQFTLQTNVCDRSIPVEQWPRAVIYIKSGLRDESLEYRDHIRATWGKEMAENRMRYQFIIGLPYPLAYLEINETKKMAQEAFDKLKAEHDKHGDILQGNYLEEWKHLANKYWSQLAYHAQFCQHVPLMVMTDNDMVLMPNRLARYIDKHPTQFQGRKQACSAIFNSGEALRTPVGGKYYISEKQWPPSILPHYCTGTTQITTLEAVTAMAKAVSQLGIDYYFGFEQLDDVGSGVIAQKANVTLVQIAGAGITPYPPVSNVCDPGLIGLHGLKPILHFDNFWKLRQTCCFDGTANETECVEKVKFTKRWDIPEKPE